MKNTLKAGFARVDVTPPLGIEISGYFKERIADGVLDNLEVNALALSDGKKSIVILSVDNCGIRQSLLDEYRKYIAEKTGLMFEAIIIHSTHIHTGPSTDVSTGNPFVKEYVGFLKLKLADAATLALADLKPAQMGYGIGIAPNISFVRRFRMKDGSVKTNPGVDNPDIVAPIGDVDERVNVVRFDREGAETVLLVSFADHPDVVGGNKITADWPGFTRKFVEKAIDNVKCVFINGAQGDVNHVNVHPKGGDLNDMFMDFDDVSRGYGHARYMGRVVLGGVLQAYDKVKYVDVDSVNFTQKVVNISSNMPTKEQLPQARRFAELHNAGKDSEIPYEGMMLTTVVAESLRMLRLENGPEVFPMEFSAISVGNIALVGIPGEPFTGIGRGIKEAKGWDLILTSCLTNGSEGYFPMKDSYDEGGYEARSSNFKSGTAEYVIEEGKEILKALK